MQAPAVFEAIEAGDLLRLENILRADPSQASVVFCKEVPNQPIHCTQNGRIAQILVSFGADVNARGDWEQTPLHYAALDANLELAQWLLDHGADIEARSHQSLGGWTPLLVAAKGRNPRSLRVAELLLGYGAYLDVHSALILRRLEYVRTQLKTCPDVIKKSAGAEGLLSEAVCFIDDYLSEHGRNGQEYDDGLMDTAFNECKDVLELLIARGAPKTDSYSALHAAVQMPHPGTAKLLLEYGADTRPPNDPTPGLSVIAVACNSLRAKQMIEVLRQHGVEGSERELVEFFRHVGK